MQENQLTDQQFWARYWESKPDIITEPGADYLFHDIFTRLLKKHGIRKTIELGGFPGYHSVYLKKYHQADPTLLDYYIHRGILKQLIQKNALGENDIRVIEADLFDYVPEETYDLVFSCGLIEHFEDTRDIIARHLPFLNEKGVLLITLPNFRGVNGWFQRRYD
ncbi:MAG TPA: class I SAM-dependent methyltransferase, partial [Anseongella sp.]|nr:class I SAM-dependent methyltransferase [Anseongella sp.]